MGQVTLLGYHMRAEALSQDGGPEEPHSGDSAQQEAAEVEPDLFVESPGRFPEVLGENLVEASCSV